MFESLKASAEALEAARSAARAAFKEHLRAAFGELFAAHPALQAVRWNQYTPYFNDGDACVFSIGDWSAKIDGVKGYNEDDDSEDSEYVDEYDLRDKQPAIKNDVARLFGLLDGDLMQEGLGDHSKITATRAGFEVEEYEHD